MRLPKYLSPSSLKTFEKDRSEFYIKYLADNRPDRLPQTEPMSVGSAFDAYVKSYLHYALFGNYGADNAYERDSIFESQVEPNRRDFARVAGEHVFQCYNKSGALADMMFALQRNAGPPRFEFSIEGFIDAKIGHIPLLGKPDIYFINDQGARVIWDWKVNGYCGKAGTSPAKGYVKCRDAWSSLEAKASRGNGDQHKDCILIDHLGIKMNGAQFMEDCNAEWAAQLAIYSWLLGEEIGSEQVIVGIDQIVSNGKRDANDKPYLRIAHHRTRISASFQYALRDRLNLAWRCITSGHLFSEVSREESDMKIKRLEEISASLADGDEISQWVNTISRKF